MRNKLLKVGRGKQQLSVPTPAEMRLLHVLWDLKEASVDQVVNAHPEKERPNYKTTQTLLRIMEQKGFIAHESRGRVFRLHTPSFSKDYRQFICTGAGVPELPGVSGRAAH